MYWNLILTETVENLEIFLFSQGFGYNLEG